MHLGFLVFVLVTIIVSGSALAQPVTSDDPLERAIAPDPLKGVPRTDEHFYNYSWRSFIALNWPAQAGTASLAGLNEISDHNRGLPDRARSFGDIDGPRVWMTWKSRHEIFQPGSPPPAEWASYDGKNPCGEDFSNDVVTLGSFSKFSDFNQTSVDNPLIAQNHTYVRYEVRVNKEEFESIVDNNWYLYDKLPNSGQPGRFKIGSTSIKAAWRVLLESETPIRKRYYVARAQVFDYARQKCIPQDVALVGLHIVTKAKERPQWIWSTFEHIDNVPSEPPVSIGPFSFNNPKLPQKLIPQMPLPPISCENKPITANPMQVIRYQEINPDVMNMNRAYWKEKEIKDTVWKNYMLVAAQWPLLPNGPMNDASEGPGNDGFPFRPRGALSNTTMETYLQQFEHNGMSCMECHNRANKLGRDFVMFVGRDAYLSSHGLAPGDHFSSKLAGGSCNAGNVLSDDPMLKSLLDFFRDAARER